MTVGELIDQLQRLVRHGACTLETPVLSDGCDCWVEARAAVVLDHGLDSGKPAQPHLLVSREDDPPAGVRVGDLVTSL